MWFERYGRTNLPWQRQVAPYRVWVSEIMLQQTQVTTVIGYFERFMTRFPTVHALAAAPVDEVLHYWSGLGYYARARNLHKTAQRVVVDHAGVFPTEREQLEALPGIGRSTAGAICSLSMNQREPILDGNVKRVLCRYHAIETWWGDSATLRELWALSDYHTPSERFAEYTQAIMDLGATVCVRRRPVCDSCPLSTNCLTRQTNRQHVIPAPKPKRERPKRTTTFVVIRDREGALLLRQRPPTGIWGGLWSFPECEPEVDAMQWCRDQLGLEPSSSTQLPTLNHGFTHFDLDIEPVLLCVDGNTPAADKVMEDTKVLWYKPHAPSTRLGLAAPVSELLLKLASIES